VTALVRDGLDCCPRKVGSTGALGDSDDSATRFCVPPGAAQTGERGYQVYATVVGDLRGERAGLRRLVDEPQAVAQPLNGCARGEDRALEGVVEAVHSLRRVLPEVPGDCRQ